jgi:hypothetical protein
MPAAFSMSATAPASSDAAICDAAKQQEWQWQQFLGAAGGAGSRQYTLACPGDNLLDKIQAESCTMALLTGWCCLKFLCPQGGRLLKAIIL